jgi:hypothetical protein
LTRGPSLTVNHFSIRTYAGWRRSVSTALCLLNPAGYTKEDVDVREILTRSAVWALSITLGLGAAVAPCAAAEKAGTTAGATKLTRLSPASQHLLARPSVRAVSTQDQPGASSESFFRTKRGAITLILMGAGAGFTLWSINHDRKPVKSPIR